MLLISLYCTVTVSIIVLSIIYVKKQKKGGNRLEFHLTSIIIFAISLFFIFYMQLTKTTYDKLLEHRQEVKTERLMVEKLPDFKYQVTLISVSGDTTCSLIFLKEELVALQKYFNSNDFIELLK
jgi:hypothetical protein